jgi:uncharacterized protein YodC (DUF2158 family)
MVDQNTLKVGDLVQLMSGGAKMTVLYPRGDFGVTAMWISDKGDDRWFTGPPEMLKLASDAA